MIDDPAFPAAEGKTLPQVPRRRATLVVSYRADDRTTLTLAGALRQPFVRDDRQ